MFTKNPNQLRDRQERARQIAEQVAVLLNQVNDLGLGPVMGSLIIPGVDIRTAGGKWEVR